MIKIGFIDKKKIKTIIQYIVCLLIIEASIVGIGITKIFFSNRNDAVSVVTETASINTTQLENEPYTNYARIHIEDYKELSYYIKVNLKTQMVTIYTTDENNEYTIPIKKMICSTGESTPTEGVYGISDKFAWAYLVGNVYGQYATRITGPILFHSVPYTSHNKSSLEYWEFDKLGQPVSKGCVRLTVEDAKWIFDNCRKGTKVEFYSEDEECDTKEKMQIKISDYSDELRGWDPTDPDPKNPWIEYREQNKGEND